MTTITSFTNVEDMLEHIGKQRQNADQRVADWQATIKTGDCFLRYERSLGVVIYGYIEEIKDEEDKQLYKEPHMKYFRPTRCFSIMCPEGKYGDVHVSSIDMIVSKETFEKAKNNDWPNDLGEVVDLVDLQ